MTAWRMASPGFLPGAALSPAGRWLVEVDELEPVRLTVADARASSHDQAADLDRQVARIAACVAVNGTHIAPYVREFGSGLNDTRRALGALLADPTAAWGAGAGLDRDFAGKSVAYKGNSRQQSVTR
jgi:predicted site-specific integrase-resolvase